VGNTDLKVRARNRLRGEDFASKALLTQTITNVITTKGGNLFFSSLRIKLTYEKLVEDFIRYTRHDLILLLRLVGCQ
jgi:hypothetical protein